MTDHPNFCQCPQLSKGEDYSMRRNECLRGTMRDQSKYQWPTTKIKFKLDIMNM